MKGTRHLITLRIHMLGVLTFGIKMFGKVRSKYQCWKDKARIPRFGKKRPEFQCLER